MKALAVLIGTTAVGLVLYITFVIADAIAVMTLSVVVPAGLLLILNWRKEIRSRPWTFMVFAFAGVAAIALWDLLALVIDSDSRIIRSLIIVPVLFAKPITSYVQEAWGLLVRHAEDLDSHKSGAEPDRST